MNDFIWGWIICSLFWFGGLLTVYGSTNYYQAGIPELGGISVGHTDSLANPIEIQYHYNGRQITIWFKDKKKQEDMMELLLKWLKY